MSLTIKSLDHLVLTVRSLSRTTEFYTRHLGMRHSVFTSKGTERHALLFGNQKINLHLAGHEFDPCAERPVPGSADLCFVTDVKVGEVAEMWKKEGIEMAEDGKVVDRTGAVGKLKSVYCRDPDGNLIEVSNYVD